MPYQLPDGRLVSPDRAFTLYDIQYPAGWLRNSTAQDRAELGIVWVNPGPTWDQRFYWGYDSEGQLIPKDHAELVTLWTAKTRHTANSLLFPTDWMVVRQADNGTMMNQDWKNWRESVRIAAADKVQQIEATVRTSDLAEYVTSSAYSTWPNDPDNPPTIADDPVADGVEPSGDGIQVTSSD